MKKTLFLKVFAMSALLSVAFTASAFAAEKTSEDGVYVQDGVVMCSCGTSIKAHREEMAALAESPEARNIPCSCGGRLVESLLFASPWDFTGAQRPCVHGSLGGYDKERYRNLIYRTTCNRCDISFQRTATETQWACHGVT